MSEEHILVQILHAVEREREVLERIERLLNAQFNNRVLGGVMAQIPSGDPMALVPIQPGQTPVFQVAPTFSGPAFTTEAANAAVTSSDPANFPVSLVASDPTGLTFQAAIPPGAAPTGGDEPITVTWTYTNPDGTVATVTGTVTETSIDDVTGGTFTQIS